MKNVFKNLHLTSISINQISGSGWQQKWLGGLLLTDVVLPFLSFFLSSSAATFVRQSAIKCCPPIPLAFCAAERIPNGGAKHLLKARCRVYFTHSEGTELRNANFWNYKKIPPHLSDAPLPSAGMNSTTSVGGWIMLIIFCCSANVQREEEKRLFWTVGMKCEWFSHGEWVIFRSFSRIYRQSSAPPPISPPLLLSTTQLHIVLWFLSVAHDSPPPPLPAGVARGGGGENPPRVGRREMVSGDLMSSQQQQRGRRRSL